MRTVEEIKADIASCDGAWIDSALCRSLRCELYETILGDIQIDRLEAICAAEKDGRLVTLPCKVGDKVWVHDRDGRPREMILDAPDIRCHCAKEDEVCMALCGSKNTGVCAYRLKNDGSDIGKAVFLTRAEAERELGKEQDER